MFSPLFGGGLSSMLDGLHYLCWCCLTDDNVGEHRLPAASLWEEMWGDVTETERHREDHTQPAGRDGKIPGNCHYTIDGAIPGNCQYH